MRELHGVMSADAGLLGDTLKQRALLFDRIHVIYMDVFVAGAEALQTLVSSSSPSLAEAAGSSSLIPDLEFLQSRKFLVNVGRSDIDALTEKFQRDFPAQQPPSQALLPDAPGDSYASLCIRAVSAELDSQQYDAVVITGDHFKEYDLAAGACIIGSLSCTNQADVLRVAIQAFPTPDDTCSWQDIMDFKSELHDKQWIFRRFLYTLATKNQTEAEIRDDIEWTVNEYTKAMALHHIKSAQSFVDVFVISPLEMIENLVKLNWSKIAKGVLSVQKRKVELMEAEMKAPGRECAYVFDARKRFGSPRQ